MDCHVTIMTYDIMVLCHKRNLSSKTFLPPGSQSRLTSNLVTPLCLRGKKIRIILLSLAQWDCGTL